MRLWKRLYWLQGGSLKYFGWDLRDPRYFGGVGGAPRVNSTPMGRFLPLGKSCTAPKLVPNTTLWFNWPSLTGYASLTQCIAMLDLWDPSKDPQKTTLWANESLSEPQKVPKFHIEGPKCILLVATIHFEHYLTFGTKSGDSGPFESNFSWSFQRPKGQILDYLRPKRAWFAQKMAFWRPLKGSKISQIGSVMRTQWSLASWTILWNLEPILVM